MASTSFIVSNQMIARKFSATPPPHSLSLRLSARRTSAGYATAERPSAAYATAERPSAAWNENASQTASLYEVLGVQTGATCQEIKFAYRKLARVLHPDAAAGNQGGDDGASSAADKFMRVHAAYATLSDPEKRAVYDSSLFQRRARAAVLSASGYSVVNRRRRTWETDQCW